MVDKVSASIRDAVATVKDGSTVMTGGFGAAGVPDEVIEGLLGQGAGQFTLVANNAGDGDTGLAALLKNGRVGKDAPQLSAPGGQLGVRWPLPRAKGRTTTRACAAREFLP